MTRGRKFAALLGLVLAFGALRLPLEHRVHASLLASGARSPAAADLGLREQLGQNGFLALLGGFRSLLASIIDLLAREEWEKVNYGKVESYYRLAQYLQPEVYYFWDTGGWMLARNAAFHYRNPDLGDRWQQDEQVQTWVRKGLSMYEEATRRQPRQRRLWEQIGRLYTDSVVPRNYPAAADAYLRAAALPDAPSYLARNAGYCLAESPGRQREAYQVLLQCYREDRAHTRRPGTLPSLAGWLKTLEGELAIPLAERIPEPWPREFRRRTTFPDGTPRPPAQPSAP